MAKFHLNFILEGGFNYPNVFMKEDQIIILGSDDNAVLDLKTGTLERVEILKDSEGGIACVREDDEEILLTKDEVEFNHNQELKDAKLTADGVSINEFAFDYKSPMSSVATAGSIFADSVHQWMREYLIAQDHYKVQRLLEDSTLPSVWIVNVTGTTENFISHHCPQVNLPYVFVCRWDDAIEIYKLGDASKIEEVIELEFEE